MTGCEDSQAGEQGEINGTIEITTEVGQAEGVTQKGKEKSTPDLTTWAKGHMVAQLDKQEVEPEIQKWKCALIAYFLGETPGYNVICIYIAANWKNIEAPEVFYHDEGYYIIKFQSIEDMQAIYYTRHYSINNRTIILKQWTPNFDFSVEFPSEIPLWVLFPNLPMNYWGCGSLSRIARLVGNPIYDDECTSKQTRISYARMFIKVNVTKALPTQITIMDPNGEQYVQKVEYDWKSEFCDKCMRVGHKCIEQQVAAPQVQMRRRQQKNVTQVWKHKKLVTEQGTIIESNKNEQQVSPKAG
ncbi:hypothetical protein KY290_019604 [Solanum tuberosum]|uniref:DUF4283 domain-containing protein n=1 Tax=Solanum tuberosum TaxID=4113 RepID=A0ABQ7VHU2_SOLTU|nr:hypothetical protein KY290_019604 [Solanum tuberosum]